MFVASEVLRERFWKAILTFFFSLLSVALIVTWNTPATGYESSIYYSTPLILWLSLIASMLGGITLVVISVAKDLSNKTYLWKMGIFLVILCYVICLGLFIIRGYYLWRMPGDPAIHMGWIMDTLCAGHIPDSLIYPAMHIYLSEFMLIMNLDLLFLHKIIPLIFSILFVIFMYVLSKILFANSTVQVLVTLISCCLAYSWYLQLTPNVLANFCLPLILFLLYKGIQQKSLVWTIPFIIVLLLMPVFHALPTMIIIVVFFTLGVSAIILNVGFWNIKADIKYLIRKYHCFIGSNYIIILPFIILLVWWVFWISLFNLFDQQILSIYGTITLEQDGSWLSDLTDKTSYAQSHGYNVVEQIIRQLWGQIFLCLMSALSLPLIINRSLYNHNSRLLISLLLAYGVVIFLSILFYLFNVAFTPQRFLFAISMFGTFFTAYLLSYLLISKTKGYLSLKPLMCSIFVIIFVFCLFMGGLLALYPSPYTLSTNLQNTHSEVTGVIYVLDHRDVSIPIYEISGVIGRFSYAFLNPEERVMHKLPLYFEQQRIPSHFGYNNNLSISTIYTAETDIVLTQIDKRMYIDTFPEMAEYRFTTTDFDRIKVDPGIHFIYSNGEFEYFKIVR